MTHGQRGRSTGRSKGAGSREATDDSGVRNGSATATGEGVRPGSSFNPTGAETTESTSTGIEGDSSSRSAPATLSGSNASPSGRALIASSGDPTGASISVSLPLVSFGRSASEIPAAAANGSPSSIPRSVKSSSEASPRSGAWVKGGLRGSEAEIARLDDGGWVRGAVSKLGRSIAELAHDRVRQRGRRHVEAREGRKRRRARSAGGGRDDSGAGREGRGAEEAEQAAGSGGASSASSALTRTSSPEARPHPLDRAPRREIAQDFLEQHRVHVAAEEHRARGPPLDERLHDRARRLRRHRDGLDIIAASSLRRSIPIVRAPVVTLRAARARATGRASCAVSEPPRSRSSAGIAASLEQTVNRPAPTPSIAPRTRSPRSKKSIGRRARHTASAHRRESPLRRERMRRGRRRASPAGSRRRARAVNGR